MEGKGSRGSWVVMLLVAVLVGASFMIGRLSAKVEALSKATPAAAPQGGQPAVAGAAESPLTVDKLKGYAKDLKLNSGKFDKCLDSDEYAQKVKDDLAYGSTVGVSGTPSFFVNKVRVVGSQPQQVFEDVIDYELAGGDWGKPTEKLAYLLDKNQANGEAEPGNPVETGKGYRRGGDGAAVKVVEFSDFQCPYCARAYPVVNALLQKYGDKVSLEYRHYPLAFHPYAQKAGEASECAGQQGKFWEMHDKLFDLQQG